MHTSTVVTYFKRVRIMYETMWHWLLNRNSRFLRICSVFHIGLKFLVRHYLFLLLYMYKVILMNPRAESWGLI